MSLILVNLTKQNKQEASFSLLYCQGIKCVYFECSVISDLNESELTLENNRVE